MYTILLTDDEQIVIDSLTMIINKNFSDEVCIETALSGTQALEKVRSKNIDIIFMDIHMPGINGLETISLIKQINPNIVIVILSAYDQFQYAQEALNLGAYKYLTKPVNRNLIVQTVRNAMNMIDSHRGTLSDSIELHEKLSLVSTMVESDFIYSCIFNNRNTDFSEYLSYFGIANSPYYMCSIELPDLSQEKRLEAYVKVRDVLTSKARCIIGSYMENKVVAFFPVHNDDEKAAAEKQRELMGQIFVLLSTKISARIKMGVSDIFSDISDTQLSYNNSLSALNTSDASGGIAFFRDTASARGDGEKSQQTAALLVARIRAGDAAGTRSLCSQFISLLFDIFSDLDKIRNNIFEALINIRNAVLELDGDYKNEAFDTVFPALARLTTPQEFESYLTARSIECVTAISGIRSGSENPVIKKACEYIESHLSENFGLETLAQLIGVSPYYLSKLFKEEKGETFINYVTTLRLEKAKRLLADDSMIIKEITASVGYNDQNYFSKLFRQKFGLTPTEYKESLRGN